MRQEFKEGDRFSHYDHVKGKRVHRVIDRIELILIQNVRGKPKNRKIYHFVTDPKTYTLNIRGEERKYEYTNFKLTDAEIRDKITRSVFTYVKPIAMKKRNTGI